MLRREPAGATVNVIGGTLHGLTDFEMLTALEACPRPQCRQTPPSRLIHEIDLDARFDHACEFFDVPVGQPDTTM